MCYSDLSQEITYFLKNHKLSICWQLIARLINRSSSARSSRIALPLHVHSFYCEYFLFKITKIIGQLCHVSLQRNIVMISGNKLNVAEKTILTFCASYLAQVSLELRCQTRNPLINYVAPSCANSKQLIQRISVRFTLSVKRNRIFTRSSPPATPQLLETL